MNKRVEYNGKIITVSEEIYECLNTFKRKESNRGRQLRRHELLWDGGLLEGMDAARDMVGRIPGIEEELLKSELYDQLWNEIRSLNKLDQLLLVDKVVNGLKYRELSLKYELPISTIDSKLRRIKKNLKEKLK